MPSAAQLPPATDPMHPCHRHKKMTLQSSVIFILLFPHFHFRDRRQIAEVGPKLRVLHREKLVQHLVGTLRVAVHSEVVRQAISHDGAVKGIVFRALDEILRIPQALLPCRTPEGNTTKSGSRYALRNIDQRLDLMYHHDYQFRFFNNPTGGAGVYIETPLVFLTPEDTAPPASPTTNAERSGSHA